MPSVLVSPGIGDIYWVLVKLKSLIEHENLKDVDVFTWEGVNPGRERSSGYIKRVPFVNYGGTYDEKPSPAFGRAYKGCESVVAPYDKFDYFMCPNGLLVNGHDWTRTFLADYETQWQFELTEVDEPDYKQEFGRYVVSHVSSEALYKQYWLDILTPKEIYKCFRGIADRLNAKIILTGMAWDDSINQQLSFLDTAYAQQNDVPEILHNKSKETDIDQFFALLKQSVGVIGFPSGATIKSVFFKKPTMMIWSRRCFAFSGFYSNLVNPEAEGSWYDWSIVEEDTSNAMVDKFVNLVLDNEI